MIVAMGVIKADGQVIQGYNISSAAWSSGYQRYHIELTGIDFDYADYVTVVTGVGGDPVYSTASSMGGSLVVYLFNSEGDLTTDQFSFIVLEVQ